jgi:hypothetical protein
MPLARADEVMNKRYRPMACTYLIFGDIEGNKLDVLHPS